MLFSFVTLRQETLAQQALEISAVPTLGRLNALMGIAHVASFRGDRETALKMLDEGRRVFDIASSHEQDSGYAVPEWRMNVFFSLLFARLGEEQRATEAQDTAAKLLPSSLPRFATHLEMHRGLMLVRAGNRIDGIAHARAALNKLPPDKHSLTLRMLMTEIEAKQQGR